MRKRVTAAIALGSNLGDRALHLRNAIQMIGSVGLITAVSSFHCTAPVGYLEQPDFLNAALLLETSLEPLALLEALLAMEQRMGRMRTGVPAKGPRVIDLDLLLYGAEVLMLPTLKLPHAAMHERIFVLAPLVEIAPEWVHPVLGQTVESLLRGLTGIL